MRIYDCFTFFDELNLLELRLHQMAPFVDVFVIAESPVTHRGEPKPLLFQQNRDRFAAFADKIRHIVIDDMPDSADPWRRENHQRESLQRGLHDAAPDDLVIISDADEIFREAAIRDAAGRGRFCFLSQDLFYFYANWRATSPQARVWTKAYAAPLHVIQAMQGLSVPREQEIFAFLAERGYDPARNIVDHAGWHFAWTGGADRLVRKMNAFAHSEQAMQQWNDPATLQKAIADQRFFYDGEALENLRLSHGFPDYLCRNGARFQELGLVSPNAAEGIEFYEPSRVMQGAASKAQADALDAAHGEADRAKQDIAAIQADRHSAAEASAHEIAALRAERDRLRAECDQARHALQAMQASTFWRLTAPARGMAGLVKRVGGG